MNTCAQVSLWSINVLTSACAWDIHLISSSSPSLSVNSRPADAAIVKSTRRQTDVFVSKSGFQIIARNRKSAKRQLICILQFVTYYSMTKCTLYKAANNTTRSLRERFLSIHTVILRILQNFGNKGKVTRLVGEILTRLEYTISILMV